MKRVTLIAILQIIIVVSVIAQIERGVGDAPGLQPGMKASVFSAMDADSGFYSLEESLISGPVVIIFYRGHWCPHCARHLKQVQDSLDLIYALGASVVAISPQNPEYLNKMEKRAGTEFTLLNDEGYIIDQEGTIAWRQFDPNYKKRSTVKDILNAIHKLNGHH